MAKSIQTYPRIDEEKNRFNSCLDPSELVDHGTKLDSLTLKQIIKDGIEYANEKSRRHIQFITAGHTDKERQEKFEEEAEDLFHYFIKYCGDPAETAYDTLNRHYSVIANDAFRNRIVQMERMNSGWRYQYIAKDTARQSGRFDSVSDLNLQEADFVSVISFRQDRKKKLNIYVSVKNRSNTMGGQDWPKAIEALENVAVADKNRRGPYLCVFGIAMEKGVRNIKRRGKTKIPYSFNTEIWFSNFFWPFFSNFTYKEISTAVLEVLVEMKNPSSIQVGLPGEVIEHFGKICSGYDLLSDEGKFNNPHSLISLFCGV